MDPEAISFNYNTPSFTLLKRWVRTKPSQRNMEILSKKLYKVGMEIWVVTIVIFYKNLGELLVYEGVGFSKLSKDHALHQAAAKLHSDYSVFSGFCEGNVVHQDCVPYKRKCTCMDKDDPEVLFDDDEDNIEKELWRKLSETSKIKILDKQLEEYFNIPDKVSEDPF